MRDKRVIILDLGGVLLDLYVERSFAALAKLGLDQALLVEKECLVNEMMQRFDKGDVEADEFFAYIESLLPEHVKALHGNNLRTVVAEAWNMMLGGIAPEKLRVIKELRDRGFRVVMLSNTNIAHWPVLEGIFLDVAGRRPGELFDALYLSFRMRKHKPEKSIFLELLHCEGVDAGECLFIDDSAVNCETARELGICSVNVERNACWQGLFNECLE